MDIITYVLALARHQCHIIQLTVVVPAAVRFIVSRHTAVRDIADGLWPIPRGVALGTAQGKACTACISARMLTGIWESFKSLSNLSTLDDCMPALALTE